MSSSDVQGFGSVNKATFQKQQVSVFRSVPMSLIQLYIPTESAQSVVNELGELGIVQLRDLNSSVSAFQRTFTTEIRRFDEMERKTRFLAAECEKEDLVANEYGLLASLSASAASASLQPRPTAADFDEMEGQLGQFEQRIIKMNTSQKELETQHGQLLERQSVLEATCMFLGIQGSKLSNQDSASSPVSDPLIEGSVDGAMGSTVKDDSVETVISVDDLEPQSVPSGSSAPRGGGSVGFVAGTISRHKMEAFQRVLWRTMRGNILVRSTDIAAPVGFEGVLGCGEKKSAFVVFAPGSQTILRIRKICEAIGCTLYDIDADESTRRTMIDETAAQIDDVYAVLFSTRQAKKAELARVCDQLAPWLDQIYRQKRIYDAMNCFGFDAATRRGFIAEGWCPTHQLGLLESRLRIVTERDGLAVAPVLSELDPNHSADLDCTGNGGGNTVIIPSHFYSTPLLQSFQEMTDAYGVPAYGEINPTVFMIISFPFLFAVMFGDVGHGFIMAAFAAWLVFRESSLQKRLASGGEIFGMIFGGRYIILLMGLFSIFTGLMYNDIFSKTMGLFPSSYIFDADGHGIRKSSSAVYPFGIDPAWVHADNGLNFLNSYKMKQSILLGMVQMLFGLVLNAANMVYRGDASGLWTTFLPQTLFMLSLFGYLCFLMLMKWITATDTSILNLFIGMVLRFGAVEGTPMFNGQRIVQTILLVVAIICVPWMLLAKPLLHLLHQNREKNRPAWQRRNSSHVVADKNGLEAVTNGKSEHLGAYKSTDQVSVSSTQRKAAAQDEEHGFGELLIHQLIHTIEFVLGAVSNTASYLRLWALSLAHAQLSEVLWTMVISSTVKYSFALPFTFLFWLIATILILVVMEGMSAFLHAIRLHWVEFNNKFYQGNGVKFEPFRF